MAALICTRKVTRWLRALFCYVSAATSKGKVDRALTAHSRLELSLACLSTWCFVPAPGSPPGRDEGFPGFHGSVTRGHAAGMPARVAALHAKSPHRGLARSFSEARTWEKVVGQPEWGEHGRGRGQGFTPQAPADTPRLYPPDSGGGAENASVEGLRGAMSRGLRRGILRPLLSGEDIAAAAARVYPSRGIDPAPAAAAGSWRDLARDTGPCNPMEAWKRDSSSEWPSVTGK